MTKVLMFWREIAMLILGLGLAYALSVIDNKNSTITERDITIAEMNATTFADNKWTSAQMELFTTVIANQNAGITAVLAQLEQTDTSITTAIDATRKDNAKKAADLKRALDELPTATDCSIMMNNMIEVGEAVKW